MRSKYVLIAAMFVVAMTVSQLAHATGGRAFIVAPQRVVVVQPVVQAYAAPVQVVQPVVAAPVFQSYSQAVIAAPVVQRVRVGVVAPVRVVAPVARVRVAPLRIRAPLFRPIIGRRAAIIVGGH